MAINKYFQEIDIQFIEESGDFTKVVAEPFDRGYGVTIGNALRRTLLTSIPGAAITSIKIDGVSHEFTSIKGVLEDIADIILNLKEVRFKMLDEGPELVLVEFIRRLFQVNNTLLEESNKCETEQAIAEAENIIKDEGN